MNSSNLPDPSTLGISLFRPWPGTELQGSRGQGAGLQGGRGARGVCARGPGGGRGRDPAAAREIKLFCPNFVHESTFYI